MSGRAVSLIGMALAAVVWVGLAIFLAVERPWIDPTTVPQLTSGGSVCIDGAGGYTAVDADADAVRVSYEQARGLEVEVVRGCPLPSVLNSSGPPERVDPKAALTDYAVGVAERSLLSPHRLIVYILPVDVYEGYFQSSPHAWSIAEMYCSGDVCT